MVMNGKLEKRCGRYDDGDEDTSFFISSFNLFFIE
jgi:hypothetical protein